MEKERMLALDVGDRRIGVAVSDPLGITAQPVGVIERVGWGPDIRRIEAYANAYNTRKIVCGLPLNMDGTDGQQAAKVRQFAEQLVRAGFEIIFFDERLSTVAAEQALIEGGVRREDRRQIVDKTAAAIILQAYLGNQSPLT